MRPFFGSLLAAGVAATLAALAPAATAAADLPVVNVIDLPSDTGGQVYYAEDLGFFRKAGLDVRVTNMTNSPAIISAVTSGAADVGFSVVGSAALARARGLAVRFIAPGALWRTANPTAELVVAAGSPLHAPADFAGKTIGVTGLADLTYYGTQAWLEQHGVDVSTVKWVEIPFPQTCAALTQHRVDAAMLVEPFLAACKDARAIAPADGAIASRFLLSGWIATESWIAAHPDVARRFAAAIHEASVWANAHRDASRAILMRHTRLSAALAARMRRDDYAEALTPSLIQPPLDAVARHDPRVARTVTAGDLIWNGG